MTDRPDDEAAETPMQRALRMKKAAQQANPKAPPGAANVPRPKAGGMAAGASKPWMKK